MKILKKLFGFKIIVMLLLTNYKGFSQDTLGYKFELKKFEAYTELQIEYKNFNKFKVFKPSRTYFKDFEDSTYILKSNFKDTILDIIKIENSKTIYLYIDDYHPTLMLEPVQPKESTKLVIRFSTSEFLNSFYKDSIYIVKNRKKVILFEIFYKLDGSKTIIIKTP